MVPRISAALPACIALVVGACASFGAAVDPAPRDGGSEAPLADGAPPLGDETRPPGADRRPDRAPSALPRSDGACADFETNAHAATPDGARVALSPATTSGSTGRARRRRPREHARLLAGPEGTAVTIDHVHLRRGATIRFGTWTRRRAPTARTAGIFA